MVLFQIIQMEISFHISWRRSYAGGICVSNGDNIAGLGNVNCRYGCSGIIRSPLSYVCTDFSDSEDWQYGGDSFSYIFPTTVNNVVTIGFVSCCWIYPFHRLNVSTTFSLTIRNDTGQINSSPHAATANAVHLQQGCSHTIPLVVSDPDNDIIQCRWAVGTECLDVCNRFPGAQLNSSSCTITYEADNINTTGSGYTGMEYYVAALMIEDFIPGSTQPLSSVALQFLVLVNSSTEPCYQRPEFIDPTLPQGTCYGIQAGETFTTQIIATSNHSLFTIVEIQTVSPSGTNKGPLHHIQDTYSYYVNITWTPTSSQLDQVHPFCYTAVNSVGSASEQTCIQILAEYRSPAPYPGPAVPNQQMVYGFNATFHINFDKDILPPVKNGAAIIKFYEFLSDVEVYRIDAASSSEVTFSNATQITVKPNYVFTEKTIYYILFSHGIVQGSEGCRISAAVSNTNFWNFEVLDITPPTITFIKNPKENNKSSNITIEWKSDENVTWKCSLITYNIVLTVNCFNASWSGYNLERGNYTLNISACDAAGNKRFSSHTFIINFTSK